jgi:hypothetical protein
MEMEAQLAFDEALARRLQEMENSPSDNETEGSKLHTKNRFRVPFFHGTGSTKM